MFYTGSSRLQAILGQPCGVYSLFQAVLQLFAASRPLDGPFEGGCLPLPERGPYRLKIAGKRGYLHRHLSIHRYKDTYKEVQRRSTNTYTNTLSFNVLTKP